MWDNEDAKPQRVVDMLTELVTLESRADGTSAGQVQANELLLYRGLRIRMGLHAGTVGSHARLGARIDRWIQLVKQDFNH
jgi:hypothetical protein